MASIKKMGDGSYKITVSLGYDVYGKKIRRYTTWVPDKEYTPRQLEKEVNRQATLFENISTFATLSLFRLLGI